ncbi:hypothetical protein CVT26_001065 [Gymnopilus dilepis]|uniref:Uncharacterized protein n=1 Tax=Gymnopilus dilepis TaxID=231916 RepID=A0A409WBI5_9AGAR|nr:hypothetical protein CVT26_001065 [Gymnopilus dilepis]
MTNEPTLDFFPAQINRQTFCHWSCEGANVDGRTMHLPQAFDPAQYQLTGMSLATPAPPIPVDCGFADIYSPTFQPLPRELEDSDVVTVDAEAFRHNLLEYSIFDTEYEVQTQAISPSPPPLVYPQQQHVFHALHDPFTSLPAQQQPLSSNAPATGHIVDFVSQPTTFGNSGFTCRRDCDSQLLHNEYEHIGEQYPLASGQQEFFPTTLHQNNVDEVSPCHQYPPQHGLQESFEAFAEMGPHSNAFQEYSLSSGHPASQEYHPLEGVGATGQTAGVHYRPDPTDHTSFNGPHSLIGEVGLPYKKIYDQNVKAGLLTSSRTHPVELAAHRGHTGRSPMAARDPLVRAAQYCMPADGLGHPAYATPGMLHGGAEEPMSQYPMAQHTSFNQGVEATPPISSASQHGSEYHSHCSLNHSSPGVITVGGRYQEVEEHLIPNGANWFMSVFIPAVPSCSLKFCHYSGPPTKQPTGYF